MAVFGNFTGKKQTQSGVFKDYAGQENKANFFSPQTCAVGNCLRDKPKLIPRQVVDVVFYSVGWSGMFDGENEHVILVFDNYGILIDCAVRLCNVIE